MIRMFRMLQSAAEAPSLCVPGQFAAKCKMQDFDRGNSVFSTKWQTSQRKYSIRGERDVAIPVREGVTLDSDIFRPDAPGKFPALLAVHAYSKAAQSVELMPIGFSYARGFMESGDFNFYVRRGYALLIVNIT